MKKLYTICLLTLATISISACTSKEPPPLKSPCVSAEGGPCAKFPANEQLFKAHPELQKTKA